eukprot:m.86236 g.86236  ORF g.86236 m.86236 type:complete len:54 (-) comp11448_c0_seq1:1415-1576(-)
MTRRDVTRTVVGALCAFLAVKEGAELATGHPGALDTKSSLGFIALAMAFHLLG